jgi:ATP-binding cassette subfamily B multidrug efflux pump
MIARGRFVEESKPKDRSRTLRRLLPYFAPFRGRLALVAVLLFLGTLLELLAPYLIGVAVDQFIDPRGASAPAWLALLVKPGTAPLAGLTIAMTLLATSYLGSWIMNVGQFRLMVRVAQRVLLHMRSQIFTQIERLSFRFFDEHEAGDLMSRLVNDTQVINTMFGEGLMRVLRMAMGLVGIVIAMVTLNWRLALAAYAVLPFLIYITIRFSRRVRQAYRQTRKTIGEVSAELQENISGVREVQAFNRESENLVEFQAVNARNRMANVEAETLSAAFLPVLDVLSTAALASVIGVGGYLVLNFTPPLVSIGVIVAFLTYVRRFYQPIRELVQLIAQLQSAIAGAERVFELLDTQPEVTDAPDAVELPPIQGQVDFRSVSFSYVEGQPVLQDVDLSIAPGQTVAIVGPTGAGKTTLVNLLPRFYDVNNGSVCIDSHDVRQVTLKSLRGQIGIVPQDTFLFSGSVMENVRYGRLEASDEEVIEAAKVANAHQFIERLPQGYQTEVGERGATLSRGNRQLLAIARVILRDPRILILDEATSSVDTRTELLIQRALSKLLEGRTSLVIAHRLSTIRNADQIIVLQEARIVERGTHASLLAAGGVYHDLYMSQFRRQEPAQAGSQALVSEAESPA